MFASLAFVALSVTVVIGTGAYVWWNSYANISYPSYTINRPFAEQPALEEDTTIMQSATDLDFQEWLSQSLAEADAGYGMGFGGMRMMAEPMALGMDMAMAETAFAPGVKADGLGSGSGPSRVSETNVQVSGLDEPDIVKTNGEEIFFSPEQRYWHWAEPVARRTIGLIAESDAIWPGPVSEPAVKTIQAWPPAELAELGEIEDYGDLLLHDDTLVVLSHDGVSGYDISDPAEPAKLWDWQQEDGVYLETARLMDGQIYLLTRTALSYDRPCPVPLYRGLTESGTLSLPCTQIWHPVDPYPSDVTYAVSVVDAATGEAGGSAAFVGSSYDSTVYMSPNALYLATGRDGDALRFMLDFLKANTDLAPSWVTQQLQKVAGYDLSNAAKQAELMQVLSRWQNSLSPDDRLELANNMQNRMADYYQANLRNWESTDIVKVDLADMSVAATGNIPGRLLNQFSMDEFAGNLRVATTIGSRGAMTWQFGFNSSDYSVSDVYVLDSALTALGSARDLGVGERIYSVRFLSEMGYVVTFKETDPFYVLDLSVPTAPEVKGELKIPGYSSYLHPIGDDQVLGIGKEGSQVKLSLFGVADPTNPTELAKYTLDEYWSDVLNTHHAFLLDDRHEAFFLPGGKGGYVFSYRGDSLSMARALGNINAKRAIYLDDYLYVIGEDRIIVLDESDWSEVNRLDYRE
jgi:inhibitor of cysteine peptidase